MGYKKRVLSDVVTNTITFTTQGDDRDINLVQDYAHNFIDIVSLDGAGAVVLPTLGTYTPFVRLSKDGSWNELLVDGVRAVINASSTGGDLTADGAGQSISFSGNPFEIKIVPSSVNVATNYKVTILQNES